MYISKKLSVNKKEKEGDNMYGAILGDIIGSPYEFDRGNKTKDFPFFDKGATFTVSDQLISPLWLN